MNQESSIERFGIVIVIILLLCILSAFILPFISFPHKVSPKVLNQARVKNIYMAIKQYKSDYNEFPNSFHELDGNNEKKKIYFSGETTSSDGNKIFFKVDQDGDGEIEVNSEKVKHEVAVWTTFEGKIINSWSDEKHR